MLDFCMIVDGQNGSLVTVNRIRLSSRLYSRTSKELSVGDLVDGH